MGGQTRVREIGRKERDKNNKGMKVTKKTEYTRSRKEKIIRVSEKKKEEPLN